MISRKTLCNECLRVEVQGITAQELKILIRILKSNMALKEISLNFGTAQVFSKNHVHNRYLEFFGLPIFEYEPSTSQEAIQEGTVSEVSLKAFLVELHKYLSEYEKELKFLAFYGITNDFYNDSYFSFLEKQKLSYLVLNSFNHSSLESILEECKSMYSLRLLALNGSVEILQNISPLECLLKEHSHHYSIEEEELQNQLKEHLNKQELSSLQVLFLSLQISTLEYLDLSNLPFNDEELRGLFILLERNQELECLDLRSVEIKLESALYTRSFDFDSFMKRKQLSEFSLEPISKELFDNISGKYELSENQRKKLSYLINNSVQDCITERKLLDYQKEIIEVDTILALEQSIIVKFIDKKPLLLEFASSFCDEYLEEYTEMQIQSHRDLLLEEIKNSKQVKYQFSEIEDIKESLLRGRSLRLLLRFPNTNIFPSIVNNNIALLHETEKEKSFFTKNIRVNLLLEEEKNKRKEPSGKPEEEESNGRHKLTQQEKENHHNSAIVTKKENENITPLTSFRNELLELREENMEIKKKVEELIIEKDTNIKNMHTTVGNAEQTDEKSNIADEISEIENAYIEQHNHEEESTIGSKTDTALEEFHYNLILESALKTISSQESINAELWYEEHKNEVLLACSNLYNDLENGLILFEDISAYLEAEISAID